MRVIALLSSLAATALLLAGCGSGSPAAAQPLVSAGDAQLVSYARCMRAHGGQISDPYHRTGHTGLSLNTSPKTPATASADAACHHFIQALVNLKMSHMRATAAPNLVALSRYAQCMRDHAVPMLDPNSEGILNLGNVPGLAGGFGRYTPQFRVADRECRHLLPAGVADNGSGP